MAQVQDRKGRLQQPSVPCARSSSHQPLFISARTAPLIGEMAGRRPLSDRLRNDRKVHCIHTKNNTILEGRTSYLKAVGSRISLWQRRQMKASTFPPHAVQIARKQWYESTKTPHV